MRISDRSITGVTALLGLCLLIGAPAAAQVDQAVSDAEAWLAAHQNADGSFGTTPELTPRDSALSVLALLGGDPTSAALANGLVYVSNVPEESTHFRSLRIQALARAGRSSTQLLDSLFSFRNGSGFGAFSAHETNVFDTALAVQALATDEADRVLDILPLVDYLRLSQNADGGWGFLDDDASLTYYTAEVLLALASLEELSVAPQVLNAATSYLLARQLPDGSFGSVLETALVYRALLARGYDVSILPASPVSYLLARQLPDGSWENDHFTTAQAVLALRQQLPNLTVTALTANPANAPLGSPITLTATVRNTGPVSAPASELVVRARTVDGEERAAAPVGALAPGAQADVQVTVPTTGDTGSLVLFALADGRAEVAELDESDNARSISVGLRTKADLAVFSSSLAVSPSRPEPDTDFTLQITAQNLGETQAPAFAWQVFELEAGEPVRELASGTAGPVDAGKGALIPVTLNLPEGEHILQVVLDAGDAVEEESEANNEAEIAFFVVESTQPDLAIAAADLTVTPAQPAAGQSATASATVRNLGTKGGNALVELFDGDPARGGVLIGSQTVDLQPGASAVVSQGFTAGEQSFVVVALVDRAGALAELDEANNAARRYLRDLPDLAVGIDNFDLSPAEPLDGDPVQGLVTVRNAGTLAATDVQVEVFDGGAPVFSDRIASIPAGGNRSVSFTWTAAGGLRNLVAVADRGGEILEQLEDNNEAGREVPVPRADGPDLAVSAVDASGLTHSAVTPSVQGSAQVTVANIGVGTGDDTGDAFAVRLFEDRDGDGRFSAGDQDLGSAIVAGLAAGATATVSIAVDAGLEFHRPLIWAEADASNVVAERREDNNRKALFGDCETLPPAAIEPVEEEWYVPGIEAETAPVVVQLSDDNGDGRIDSRDNPDVVLHTEDAQGRLVLALSGLDGSRLWAFRSSAANPLQNRLAHLAAADLDGDGVAEIVAVQTNSRLAALDHTGAVRWVSDAIESTGGDWAGSVEIGDLTGDGVPEIVVGRSVLSNTGRRIAFGTANVGRNRNYYGPFGVPYFFDQPHSIIADVDLDGQAEIVAGDALYRLVNGVLTVVWDKVVPDNLMEDGFAAVGNLDADPQAEIVYVSSNQIMVLNHDGSVRSASRVMIPFSIFYRSTFWGGPPTIADITGDGIPEILVAGDTQLIAFNAGLGVLWRKGTEDLAAVTSVTAFDLDGDGKREVIYLDENFLYVLNGTNGATLYQRPNTSKTGSEYPVIADLDNDGSAEILVPSNRHRNGDLSTQGLHALGNPGWPGARPIWNQYSYHVTNVQLDGTVPAAETPAWQASNTWRVNRALPRRPRRLPNLTLGLPRVGPTTSSGVPVTLRVGNGGRGTAPAGTKVRLYTADPAGPGASPAGEGVTTVALPPGAWQDVELFWQASGEAPRTAFAQVDPDAGIEECGEADNVLAFELTETVLPDLAIPAGGVTVPAAQVAAGQLVTVSVQVRNAGAAASPASVVRLFDGDPSGGVAAGEAALAALNPGQIATVQILWDTLGASGAHVLHAVADAEAAVPEGDETNNQGLVPVQLTVPTLPDLVAVSLQASSSEVPAGEPVQLTVRVTNRGVALAGGFEVAFRVNGAEEGRVSSPTELGAGESRDVTFTLSTLGRSGVFALQAAADPSNKVSEQSETNNLAAASLRVNAATLSLSLKTEQLTYQVNQDVRFQLTATNAGTAAQGATLRVRVVDAAGAELAVVANQEVALAPGSTPFTFTWNTGAALPGPYAGVAELIVADAVPARASASFVVARERDLQVRLFTDRGAYTPGQEAILTGAVSNDSANEILENLRARFAVLNPAGAEVFSSERLLPLLLPGAATSLTVRWAVGTAPPGSYTATLSVRDAGGLLIGFGGAPFQVDDSGQSGSGLRGHLEVSPAQVGIGAPAVLRFEVTNAGNARLADLPFRFDVTRLAGGVVARSLSVVDSLDLGETARNAVVLPTAGLEEGEYLVVMTALPPGGPVHLDSAALSALRAISIGDVRVPEGDSGTAPATFEAVLSSPSEQPVTVSFATSDATATAGPDYTAGSGTLSFAPGETRTQITVPIHGDTAPEADEVFLLTLSSPDGAVLGIGQALATLVDEEGCSSPNLIRNAGAEEGTLETDLPGWTAAAGGWTRRIADPAPIDGVASFAALAGGTAELAQEVGLAPFAHPIDQGLTFAVEGFVRTSPGPARARVIVEYRDAAGANVLGSYDSGELESPGAWRAVSDTRTVPAGTRRARVRLLVGPGGSGEVFFDRLGLRSLGVPVLTVQDAQVAEGNAGTTALQVRARVSCAVPGGVAVSAATAAGTATAGTDYETVTETLTFTPGALDQTVDVAVHGDATDEPDETLRMVFTGGADVVVLTPQVTGTILDDDGAVTVSIGDAAATEGDSGTVDATFTVTLSDESGQEVRVQYATANGTATAGADFVSASGTVVFPPGTTSRTVTVQAKGDRLNEPAESFLVRLSSPLHAAMGDGEGEGRIEDDDEVLIAVGDVRLTEGDTGTKPATFTVSLSVPSVLPATVQYATADGTALAPGDYAAASGTLTFAPGTTSQTVAVPVLGELVKEPEEVFFLRLANPTNALLGKPEGAAAILDDDGILISVGDVIVHEGNGGGTPAAPGNLSRAPGVTVRVSSAYPGWPGSRGIDGNLNTSWFTANGDAANRGTRPFFEVVLPNLATVTELRMFGNREFANGFDFFRGIFQLLGNGGAVLYDSGEVELPAPNRDLVLTFPAVEGVRRARFTATADESIEPGFAEFEVIGVLGTGSVAVVPITLSKAPTAPVTASFTTADGSALSGADYQAVAGTLFVPPGVTATDVVVPLVGDLVAEAAETFDLRLADATEAVILDGVGVTTIVDDDGWSLNGSANDLSIPGCIVLTPDLANRTGSAWSKSRVDLQASFDKTFRIFLGNHDGADGIVFTLQNVGLQALGGIGAGIGFSELSPAVGVEIDTWQNSGEPSHDHMTAIQGPGTALGTAVQASAVSADVEDGREHAMRLIWNADSRQLDAHFDDAERIFLERDLVSQSFQGVASVIYGFTAGTGSASNLHYFCETEMCFGTAASPKISVGDVRVIETDGGTVSAIFPVTLSCPSDHPVTVSFSTADGTALAGADYLSASGGLTFQPGETSKSVSVSVLGENLGEANEVFYLDLSDPVGGEIRYGRGQGTILSDETSVRVGDVAEVEGNGLATFVVPVTLPGAFGSAVSVNWATTNGTALAGADYTAASGVLTFQPGETTKLIYLQLRGDAALEADEQLFVRLSNPVGGEIGRGEAVVTLLDDDDCPSPNLIRNGAGSEPVAGSEIAGWTKVVSTAWSTTNSCFQLDGNAFFGGFVPQAELAQEVDVSSFASSIDAGVQRFRFEGFGDNNVASTDGGYGRIVVEFLDAARAQVLSTFDTGPFATPLVWRHFGTRTMAPRGTRFVRVRMIAQRQTNSTCFDSFSLVALGVPSAIVADVLVVEGSSGLRSASVPVQLTCPSTVPVALDYLTSDGTATAPSDYQSTVGTLVFQPGEMSKAVPVAVLGDTLSEGNETFSFNLASPVNAGIGDGKGQVTILDDEVTLKIGDTSVVEGNSGVSNLVFKATLSGPTTVPVTVAYSTVDDTAKAGSDYIVASGTLVFEPGETSKDVVVQVLGDTEVEPNEKLYVNLDVPINAVLITGRGTGTIVQDDIAISIGDAAVIEGSSGTVAAVFPVTLEGASTAQVSVSWRAEDGNATGGSDFVPPNPAVQTLTFQPGETKKTITVQVKGDTEFEPGEIFYVRLSSPVNAVLGDEEGLGTIGDDDDCPSPNLLRNPGGEEPLFNGEIPSWTEVKGTAWDTRSVGVGSVEGTKVFFAGAVSDAELRQDVDLSAYAAFVDAGIQRFAFQGYIRSASESPSDPGRIVIELLDANKVVLASLDSGEIVNVSAWQPVSLLPTAPAGTRFARVRLLARRVSPGNLDAYFDALSFKSLSTPTFAVSDLSLMEGDTEAVPAPFAVTLSCAGTKPITVHYATADQSAVAPSDYTAVSGELSFAPGETAKTVTVQVAGDYRNEVQEKFALRLSNVTNAVILDREGVAAVNDRDPGLPPIPGTDVTYTLDADFDLGALFSVDHDAPDTDQLQVSLQGGAFPYLWVAASDRGTIVKIHTGSGIILGEYSTNPDAGAWPNPSRTTVSPDGSVWVGNRGDGSVAHVGLPELGQCVDRNNNGVIETSSGYNDALPWPGTTNLNGGVSAARDECILHFNKVSPSVVRHVSANADGSVWVSGWGGANHGVFNLLSGETGEILQTTAAMPCGGYGGLVDRNGVVWSASLNGSVLRWDPKVAPATAQSRRCIGGVAAYGLSIDSKGDVWVNDAYNPRVWKISSDGNTVFGPYARGSQNAQGLAVDGKDDVWTSSCTCNPSPVVGHFKNDGSFLGNVVDVPLGSTGVAVDSDGKIWTANLNSSTASRIDPDAGPIGSDGVTPIGAVDLIVPLPGANPYNYSDMTGFLALRSTAGSGRWQVIQDAGQAGAAWGMIRWNTEPQASLPAGTSIVAEVRAADTVAGLGGLPYIAIGNGVPFVQQGRYLQVRFTLKRNAAGQSPVLSDLLVQTAQTGRIAIGDVQVAEGNGGTSQAVFEVTLAEPVNRDVAVSYSTADGTATAGQDYTAVSGTVTFPYGTTRQTVVVPVLGDLAPEADETFKVLLSASAQGVLLDSEGMGTILNDDVPPILEAIKTATLQVDGNAPGEANPGDVVHYEITVSNTGQGRALDVVFEDPIPANTTLVEGSVVASSGTVESTAPVRVRLAELAAGAALTVRFDVRIAEPFPEGVEQIANQGEVRSAEITTPVLTDDPSTPGGPDPTVTPVAAGPPVLAALKRDELALDADGDGVPSPGDRLRYEVTLTNSGPTPATEAVFQDLPPLHTSIVEDLVTATAGTIESRSPVRVAIGDLAPGASVTIRFEVDIANPVPKGVTEISNQGTLSSRELPPVPTDDPDLGGEPNPTVTVITAAPKLVAEKTAELAVDADLDQAPSPGDTLAYTVTVRNVGNTSATSIVLTDPVPADTALEGSPAASQGTVSVEAGEIRADLGEIAGGASATIDFRVKIADPIPARVREITNQGEVTSAELPLVKTDDPALGGDADPTVTHIAAAPVLVVEKTASLDEDADGDRLVSPGDVLLYRITLANHGNTAATDVRLADDIQAGTVYLAGSLQASQGTVVTEQPIVVDLGEIAADAQASVGFRVTVDAGFPATSTDVENQADVTAHELSQAVPSDDPATAEAGDPTRTAVFITPAVAIADVAVGESAGTAQLTVSLSRPGNREVRVAFATAEGSALAGADFTAGTGTLTFAPGETEKTVTVAITDDLLDEADEGFAVVLSAPVQATLADAEAVVTIVDDDAPPAIVIGDVSVQEGHSGTTNAGLTVTLSAPSGLEVRVDYATADGTAAGSDYTSAAGTLVFPAGTLSQTINVAATGETLFEADETVLVNLANPLNAALPDPQALVTVVNDDQPPSVSISDLTVGEGSPAELALTLSEASGLDATVTFTTADGTAQAGSDYTAAGGSVTIPAGSLTGKGIVQTLDDLLDEADETFAVALSDPVQSKLADAEAVVTIVDDDAPPLIVIGDVSVQEGHSGTTNAGLTVTLSAPSGLEVRVDYATADGTAAGSDYTSAAGTLVFPAGTLSQTINVAATGETLFEADETVLVNLANPLNAALPDPQALVTLVNDDQPPSVSISDVTVTEGDTGTTPAELTLTLSAASGLDATMTFATADGTAQAGSDYTAAGGTVTIPAGSLTGTVAVEVAGDEVDEHDELFQVLLSAPAAATLADTEGTVTITDDDEVVSLSIDDVTVAEGHSGTTGAVFRVRLSASSNSEVRVEYATSEDTATQGTDYQAASGTLTFPAGETERSVTVQVVGDLLFEGDETFKVNLSNPVAAIIEDGEGLGTITDDELCPSPNLLANPGAEARPVNGEIPGWTEVQGTSWQRRAAPPVPYQGAYSFSAGTPQFAELRQDVDVSGYAGRIDAGIQKFAFSAWALSLTEVPPDVTQVIVEYRNAANTVALGAFDSGEIANTSGWAAVADVRAAPAGTRWVRVRLLATRFAGTVNDALFDALSLTSLGTAAVTVSDAAVYEGDSGTRDAVFQVRLSCALDKAIALGYSTADGTAAAGPDYVATSGTLTLPAGTAQGQIPVPVVGDLVDEPHEAFFLNLALIDPAEAAVTDPQARGDILEDDFCQRSPGYWKTHRSAWPVAELQLGGVWYNDTQILSFLGYSGPDAATRLAHHLSATRLNLARGSEPSILPMVEQAEAFLAANPPGSNPKGALRDQANSIKDALDAYNNACH